MYIYAGKMRNILSVALTAYGLSCNLRHNHLVNLMSNMFQLIITSECLPCICIIKMQYLKKFWNIWWLIILLKRLPYSLLQNWKYFNFYIYKLQLQWPIQGLKFLHHLFSSYYLWYPTISNICPLLKHTG